MHVLQLQSGTVASLETSTGKYAAVLRTSCGLQKFQMSPDGTAALFQLELAHFVILNLPRLDVSPVNAAHAFTSFDSCKGVCGCIDLWTQ